MSFGCSIGDVIAGANLTYRLLRVMADTKGGSQEYLDAMSELSAMQQAFLQIGHIRSHKMLPTATINAASYIVLSSMETIAKFLERTKHYQSVLEDPRASQLQSSWCKVGWTLYKSHELRALRDTLHAKLTSVQVLLSAASYGTPLLPHQVIEEDQNHSLASPSPPERARELPRIEYNTGQPSDETRPARHTPDSFTASETDQSGSTNAQEDQARHYIELKDAVGRRFKFPFGKCLTWDDFGVLVKEAFISVETLSPHVQEGRYDICSTDGNLILPAIWEDIIEPGMSLVMTMWPIVERQRSPPAFARQPKVTSFGTLSRPGSYTAASEENLPHLPPHWDRRFDVNGRPCYMDRSTGRTQYHPPAQPLAAHAEVARIPPPPPPFTPFDDMSRHQIQKIRPEVEAVRCLRRLVVLTEPAVLEVIRDLSIRAIITGEQESSLIRHLGISKPGTFDELVEVFQAELAAKDSASNADKSHDSGIGESCLSVTSTDISHSSDSGTESGACWSESEGRLVRRKKKGRGRRTAGRTVSVRRIPARKASAKSDGWEDCSDSGDSSQLPSQGALLESI